MHLVQFLGVTTLFEHVEVDLLGLARISKVNFVLQHVEIIVHEFVILCEEDWSALLSVVEVSASNALLHLFLVHFPLLLIVQQDVHLLFDLLFESQKIVLLVPRFLEFFLALLDQVIIQRVIVFLILICFIGVTCSLRIRLSSYRSIRCSCPNRHLEVVKSVEIANNYCQIGELIYEGHSGYILRV